MGFDREIYFHIFIICLIIAGGFVLGMELSSSSGTFSGKVTVTKVIDGDTIVVEGGRKVRLLGIDADERNYPCYDEAKERLEELVLGKRVRLERTSENKGMYDRYLRYIFLNGTNINLKLVEEGSVVTRFSEDIRFKDKLQKAEQEAMDGKRGCKWNDEGGWLENNSQFTDPCEAEKFKGEKITIGGQITDFYQSQNDNVFLNFGGEYPNHCFTAVIFSHSLDKFDIQFNELEGGKVKVKGEVEMFEDKPEIIIENESQIKVLG